MQWRHFMMRSLKLAKSIWRNIWGNRCPSQTDMKINYRRRQLWQKSTKNSNIWEISLWKNISGFHESTQIRLLTNQLNTSRKCVKCCNMNALHCSEFKGRFFANSVKYNCSMLPRGPSSVSETRIICARKVDCFNVVTIGKNHIEKQPSIVDDHNLRAERQTEGPAFGIDEFMRILSEPRTEDKGPLNILLEVRDKLQPQLILLGPRRYWQIILTPFFGTTLGRWTWTNYDRD